MCVTALSYTLLRWYASMRAKLLPIVPASSIYATLQRSLIGPLLYFVSALVAWIGTPAAQFIYVLVPTYYFYVNQRVK